MNGGFNICFHFCLYNLMEGLGDFSSPKYMYFISIVLTSFLQIYTWICSFNFYAPSNWSFCIWLFTIFLFVCFVVRFWSFLLHSSFGLFLQTWVIWICSLFYWMCPFDFSLLFTFNNLYILFYSLATSIGPH